MRHSEWCQVCHHTGGPSFEAQLKTVAEATEPILTVVSLVTISSACHDKNTLARRPGSCRLCATSSLQPHRKPRLIHATTVQVSSGDRDAWRVSLKSVSLTEDPSSRRCCVRPENAKEVGRGRRMRTIAEHVLGSATVNFLSQPDWPKGHPESS